MIIECTSCHSKYQYDEDRFERKPSKKIKCAKCQQVFEIFNPAPVTQSAPAPVVPETGDQTFHRKESRLKLDPDPPSAVAAVPPSTGKRPANLQMPAGKRLSLAVIDGPDAGNVFRIEKPRVTVGRTGADLVLNDTEASRQHAAVEIRDTLYTLVDLGSTNGTLVDGEKITEPFELVNQAEFVVGVSTVMLIVTEDV